MRRANIFGTNILKNICFFEHIGNQTIEQFRTTYLKCPLPSSLTSKLFTCPLIMMYLDGDDKQYEYKSLPLATLKKVWTTCINESNTHKNLSMVKPPKRPTGTPSFLRFHMKSNGCIIAKKI